mmetsp:Transcript_13208/g.31021  ORF Transcript_13208/g.31021 Transcript_13208/m.31021 type:complete len:127 (-) Transcript_13208:337-717(-)
MNKFQDAYVVTVSPLRASRKALSRYRAACVDSQRWTLSTVKSLKATISDSNPYKALLDLAEEVEPKRESAFPSDLLFVVGGKNFMWATPTTTRMEPEDLLQDFLSISNFARRLRTPIPCRLGRKER